MRSMKKQIAVLSVFMVLVIAALTLGGLQLFGKGKAKPSEWFKKADKPQAEQAAPDTQSFVSPTLFAENNTRSSFTNPFLPSGEGWQVLEGDKTYSTPMDISCNGILLQSDNSIVMGKFFIYAMCYRRSMSSGGTGSGSTLSYQYAYFFVIDFGNTKLSDGSLLTAQNYVNFKLYTSGTYVDFVPFTDGGYIDPAYAICYTQTAYSDISSFISATNTVIQCAKRVPLPANPVKEGYTFVGWYYGKDTECDESCMKYIDAYIEEDTDLHAHFTIKTFTVVYDTSGGTNIESVTVNWGASAPLSSPERTGYDFTGWRLSDGTAYTNQPIKANTTLTAVWKIKTYTVTFYVGAEKYKEITVEYGTVLLDAMEEADIATYTAMTVAGVRLSKANSVITEDAQVLVKELTGFEKYGDWVGQNPWYTWVVVGIASVLLIFAVVGIVGMIHKR